MSRRDRHLNSIDVDNSKIYHLRRSGPGSEIFLPLSMQFFLEIALFLAKNL